MDRINVKIKKKYDKIPLNCKVAFFSAVIFGLVAHLYMFTNKFPNYDDVGLNSFGATFRIGRWFLWVLGAVAYHLGLVYSIPMINGMVSVVILAFSATLIVDLIDVDSPIAVVLISAVLVVFPSWTATFFFMFTAPYYAVAVFLMVLAIYVDFKYDKKILGIVLIACSVGIYQAYLSFGASLYVVLLLIGLLKNNIDVNKLFKKALSSLITLALGVVVYYIIMKISLMVTGQQIADYKGLNSMGVLSIDMLPELLKRIVRDGLGVAFNNNLEISYGLLLKLGYLFLYVVDIAIIIMVAVDFVRSREYKRLCLLILFFAAFVVGVNSIFIMCPAEGAVYSLMTYAYAFLIIFPICLVDKIIVNDTIRMVTVFKSMEYGVAVVGFVMVLAYCHFANAQYLSINLGYEQTTSYYTSLVAQIKSAEGYSDDMVVAFVYADGNYIADATMYRNDVMRDFDISGRDDVFEETYNIEYFLKYYCGFTAEFIDDYSKYQDEIDNMPIYPMNGSIKIVDNVVIVKFS